MKAKDITGAISGRLTAIKPTDRRCSGSVIWKCLCKCGVTSYVSVRDFSRTRSCGCLQKERIRQIARSIWNDKPTLHPDSHLTLIAPTSERSPDRSIIWLTQCACGEFKSIPQKYLKTVRSCGCLRRKHMQQLGRSRRKA